MNWHYVQSIPADTDKVAVTARQMHNIKPLIHYIVAYILSYRILDFRSLADAACDVDIDTDFAIDG